jgi:hypothetical protein
VKQEANAEGEVRRPAAEIQLVADEPVVQQALRLCLLPPDLRARDEVIERRAHAGEDDRT